MTTTFTAKFYNLRVSRNPQQVEKEIRALLESKPHVLGLCEALGYSLPGINGYKKWRDTSKRSRANIAVYTNNDWPCPEEKQQWHDCKETWGRTEHPGEHEPRSWWEGRLARVQLMVGHQPPKFTDNVIPSQREGIALCTRRMNPNKGKARPRIALADWNRHPNEPGPGPKDLCENINGWQSGDKIDAAVIRGKDAKTKDWFYTDNVADVKLESDHPWGALVVKISVADKWLTV